MYVGGCVHMIAPAESKIAMAPPGAAVISGCEPLEMGAGN